MNLVLKDITKTINFQGETINILGGISLGLEPGKITAIVGNSGSGKSTLLNILALIDVKSSGEYYIDSKEFSNYKKSELVKFRADNIGVIFQQYNLIPRLSSYDNVKIPLYLNQKVEKDQRGNLVMGMLDKVGLKDRSNHFPSTLSGGEQQRVAIARALINDPNIILADEPTGNVDKENEQLILSIFRKVANEGNIVVVVTHSDTVKDFADSIYRINNGRIEVLK